MRSVSFVVLCDHCEKAILTALLDVTGTKDELIEYIHEPGWSAESIKYGDYCDECKNLPSLRTP